MPYYRRILPKNPSYSLHLFVACLYYTKELDPESTIDHLRNLKITPPSPPKTSKKWNSQILHNSCGGYTQTKHTSQKNHSVRVPRSTGFFNMDQLVKHQDQGLRHQLLKPLLSGFRPILGTGTHEESCHQWLSSCTKLGNIFGDRFVVSLSKIHLMEQTLQSPQSLISYKPYQTRERVTCLRNCFVRVVHSGSAVSLSI